MERATDDYGHYSPLDEPRCASSLCPKNGPNEGMRTSTAPISWIFCVSFAGKSGRRSSTFTGYLAYLCHVICPWLDDAGVRRASDLTARRLSSKSIFDISVFFVFFGGRPDWQAVRTAASGDGDVPAQLMTCVNVADRLGSKSRSPL